MKILNILKGKTILIGRDSNLRRIMIAIPEIGKIAGIAGTEDVPASVSRLKIAENRAHVKLEIDETGSLILHTLNSNNSTFVSGKEISVKCIEEDSIIELGKDFYRLNLPLILATAKDLLERGNLEKTSSDPEFDISHLEDVWNSMLKKRKLLQANQKKINLVRSGCGVFTMCAMPCIFLFGPVGYVLTGIGILGNVYSFLGLKNDNTPEEVEKINEEFQEKYVCPNPKCKKFLGNHSYRFIKRQYGMSCPYCKSKFVETIDS